MVHVLCTKYLTEKVTSVVETLTSGRKYEGRGGCTLSELLTLSHGARCQEKEQAIIWFRVLLTWQDGRNRQAGLTKRHLKVLQQSRVRIRPLPISWQIWSNPREVCHPKWHIPMASPRGCRGLCYKTSHYQTSNYKTPKIQNVELQKADNKTSKVTKGRITKCRITKRRKLQKVEKQKVESN